MSFHNKSKVTLGRIGRGVFNIRRTHSWLSFLAPHVAAIVQTWAASVRGAGTNMIVFRQRKHSDIGPHRSWCFFTFVEIMHYYVSTTKAKRHGAASVVVFFNLHNIKIIKKRSGTNRRRWGPAKESMKSYGLTISHMSHLSKMSHRSHRLHRSHRSHCSKWSHKVSQISFISKASQNS